MKIYIFRWNSIERFLLLMHCTRNSYTYKYSNISSPNAHMKQGRYYNILKTWMILTIQCTFSLTTGHYHHSILIWTQVWVYIVKSDTKKPCGLNKSLNPESLYHCNLKQRVRLSWLWADFEFSALLLVLIDICARAL